MRENMQVYKIECPSCNGNGTVPNTDGTTSATRPCKACGGTGVQEVFDTDGEVKRTRGFRTCWCVLPQMYGAQICDNCEGGDRAWQNWYTTWTCSSTDTKSYNNTSISEGHDFQ